MEEASDVDILYGVNPVHEALRAGRRTLKCLYVHQAGGDRERLRRLAELAERAGARVQPTDKEELMRISRSREHQGVALVCSPYPLVRFEEVPWDTADRLVLLDNIEDPHNLGAILRSCEVFGYPCLLLPLKGTPGIYPSVVKASAGATEHLKVCRGANANRYAQVAKEKGFQIVALDEEGATSLDSVTPAPGERLLLVIGGEDKSVGRFILNLADRVVRIPQRGRVGSLNASVAAGVALHALRSPGT
jgi:23S rRNA (guanosine2251-2'-O)-methyltransferase